jgi:hypothetical protein
MLEIANGIARFICLIGFFLAFAFALVRVFDKIDEARMRRYWQMMDEKGDHWWKENSRN